MKKSGSMESNTTAIGCALSARAATRLLTRNGHNWTSRFPWIVEATLKNREQQFVIDGEAVVLSVDGVSDFNVLHSRKHDAEVQLYAFDLLALALCLPAHRSRLRRATQVDAVLPSVIRQ